MRRLSREQVEGEIAALEALDTRALRDRWLALYCKDPPPKFRANLLRLGIAYRLQERTFGGLQPRTVRLLGKLAADLRDERVSRSDNSRTRPGPSRPTLSIGSQLLREWNGSTEIVDVTSDGFRWKGREYRTLSAVAVAITGTKWSGPKFFGLATPAARSVSIRSAPVGFPASAQTEPAGELA
jgi:hypothetical protein